MYGILVTLGVGTLLPWNVMITEKEFFDVRLHVEPYDARVAGNFMSLFGLTFNTANLLAFCAVACLHSGRLSLRAQIAAPLIVILLLLSATAGVALRLDLPGTAVACYTLPALAVLVRNGGLHGNRDDDDGLLAWLVSCLLARFLAAAAANTTNQQH